VEQIYSIKEQRVMSEEEWQKETTRYTFYQWRRRLSGLLYERCGGGHKGDCPALFGLRRVLWFEVGNHDDCIPF